METDRVAPVNADEEVAAVATLAGRDPIFELQQNPAPCTFNSRGEFAEARRASDNGAHISRTLQRSGARLGREQDGSHCIKRRTHWSATDSRIDHLFKVKSAFPRGRAPMFGCVRGNSKPSSSCCSTALHRSGFRPDDDPRRLQERGPRRRCRCVNGRSNLCLRPTEAVHRGC